MKTPLVAAVLVGVSLASCATKLAEKRHVIVAVVAHPDDEAAMAQLLVKYGKTHKVNVVIVTDGRYGIKPGFPTGDALVKLRQSWGTPIASTAEIPRMTASRATSIQSMDLKRVLAEKLDALNADAVLTFGPDGETGHLDHRMVSNIATEVILS